MSVKKNVSNVNPERNAESKLSYLKGLIEGLCLDQTKKDTKVINNLIGLLEDIVAGVSQLEENTARMQKQIDAVDIDLGELEKDLYEEDDCCCAPAKKKSDPDELYYEVTCPNCGDTISLDDSLISKGEIDCPNCGEKLEFDLDS